MFDIRGRGGSRPTRARGIRSRRSDPVALHARRGSCKTKSATHLWTHVVRLAVPRVGPAFPAVRCVVPGFARDALPRETHVSAPKRAAADVTRPRGPLPRDARLIGTPRRDRRGRFLRGGPHRPRQARQPLRINTNDKDIFSDSFVSSFSRLPRNGILFEFVRHLTTETTAQKYSTCCKNTAFPKKYSTKYSISNLQTETLYFPRIKSLFERCPSHEPRLQSSSDVRVNRRFNLCVLKPHLSN